MRLTKKTYAQHGFTLVELAFTIFIFGILSISMSGAFRSFLTAKDQSYQERQLLINTKISAAMQEFAGSDAFGKLPSPYNNSTSKIFYGLANPAVTTGFSGFLLQQGLSMREVNNDGTTGANVRVYQKVSINSLSIPLYFQSGPLVDLAYEQGYIYMTDCMQSMQATCNSTAASSTTPPKGNKLTSTNVGTWAPSATDISIVAVSNLPLQKKMLQITASRLDAIKEAMQTYVKAKQATAPPLDTTNWFPAPTDSAYWVGIVDLNPSLNQGCRNGWYALDSSTSMDIMKQIGFPINELARTAWGGSIEYCRKYDPNSATAGAGSAPHYAALRINRFLSSGGFPDPSVAANNVTISF